MKQPQNITTSAKMTFLRSIIDYTELNMKIEYKEIYIFL